MGSNYDLLIFMCTILCAHYVVSQVPPPKTNGPRTVIKVATVESIPLVMALPDGTLEGILPDLLREMEDLIPYTFSLYLSNDEQHGALENGTWTGLMGEVVNRVADLALPLTVTYERSQYVDFSIPLQTVETAIVLRKPRSIRNDFVYNLSTLLVPMSTECWLVTVLAFLVTSTVLYIISRTNPYEWRRMAQDKEATEREAESFTCLNSFWFVVSTLAWQGYSRAPRSLGGRIVVTAWWFFVLIFIVSYIAGLTNFLRVDPTRVIFKKPFKSFSDISKSSVYVVMISGGDTALGFKHSNNPDDQKIYKNFEGFERQHKPTRTVDRGLRYLREGHRGMVMAMESQSARYIVNRKPCDLFMMSESKTNMFTSIAVAKTSTILSDINNALVWLHGNDTMVRLQNKWISSMSECEPLELETCEDNKNVFSQITLATFSGAPSILLIGLVFGGLMSAIEVCIYKKRAGSHPVANSTNLNDQTELASSEHILGYSKTDDAAHV